MSDDKQKDDRKGNRHDESKRLKVVHCRRTGQEYDVGIHKQCPYCFGEDRDIATGDHEKFCDFCPGEDPVNFGFPEHNERLRRG